MGFHPWLTSRNTFINQFFLFSFHFQHKPNLARWRKRKGFGKRRRRAREKTRFGVDEIIMNHPSTRGKGFDFPFHIVRVLVDILWI